MTRAAPTTSLNCAANLRALGEALAMILAGDIGGTNARLALFVAQGGAAYALWRQLPQLPDAQRH